jgi:hypothetical protein
MDSATKGMVAARSSSGRRDGELVGVWRAFFVYNGPDGAGEGAGANSWSFFLDRRPWLGRPDVDDG